VGQIGLNWIVQICGGAKFVELDCNSLGLANSVVLEFIGLGGQIILN
jgi:hypothetical protein